MKIIDLLGESGQKYSPYPFDNSNFEFVGIEDGGHITVEYWKSPNMAPNPAHGKYSFREGLVHVRNIISHGGISVKLRESSGAKRAYAMVLGEFVIPVNDDNSNLGNRMLVKKYVKKVYELVNKYQFDLFTIDNGRENLIDEVSEETRNSLLYFVRSNSRFIDALVAKLIDESNFQEISED